MAAQGGSNGAGIGGGSGGNGGQISISGGTVAAQGGSESAGIGGGYSGNGEMISITGGVAAAQGGSNGAGIGGGDGGNGGVITIGGSTVVAQGGSDSAAGIGGGSGGSPSTFPISTSSRPIIFASSIPEGTGTMQDGIATDDNLYIDITPGSFPDELFQDITVVLNDRFTVPSGATLTIPSNMTLDLDSFTLTNNGTVDNQGRVLCHGGGVEPIPLPNSPSWTGDLPE